MATNNAIKHPYEDDQRNINFGEMLDYIKRSYDDVNTQNDLAIVLGVSKDTISNIKQGNTSVSDDFISKVMARFEGVFNIQWLKGRSKIMLQKDVSPEEKADRKIDEGSAVNAALAAKDVTIASKDETIASKNQTIESKDQTIASLERELKTKDVMIDMLRERVNELKELRQQPKPQLASEPSPEKSDKHYPDMDEEPLFPMGVAEP